MNTIKKYRNYKQKKITKMKFFSISLLLLCMASPVIGALFDGSIPAESKLAQKLLGKSRQLENNNNYNSY